MSDNIDPNADLRDKLEVLKAQVAAQEKAKIKAQEIVEACCADWKQWTCPSCGSTGLFSPDTINEGKCGECRLKALGMFDGEIDRHIEESIINAVKGNREHAEAHVQSLIKQLLKKLLGDKA